MAFKQLNKLTFIIIVVVVIVIIVNYYYGREYGREKQDHYLHLNRSVCVASRDGVFLSMNPPIPKYDQNCM